MNIAVTTAEQEKYVPNANRSGIGLSLSGGGFRASLFHLGAIRRLNELGVLKKVRSISSVSGGSILNAFVALNWPLPPPSDFEIKFASIFRKFCQTNIRRGPTLKGLIPFVNNSKLLADKYDELLTKGRSLVSLPSSPAFIFCSTDLAFGVDWTFRPQDVGDYQAGSMPTPADWKLSKAVAASSCFPPVFEPISLGLDPNKLHDGLTPPGAARDECIRGLTLSDGGVYDNLGLEPIWKDHAIVLASDGGATFDIGADKSFLWEIQRYFSIPENQALALRKRWLVSNFLSGTIKGAYWGIGSAAESYGVKLGYSKDLACSVIVKIRTDLDAFSDVEAAILENHGYCLAEVAIQKHVSTLALPGIPFAPPHPDWWIPSVAEDKIREALKGSNKRTLLGRG